MFIVSLTYRVPLERVDAHIKEHVAFLDRHYEAGYFLMSGRKNPRTGGIIVVTIDDRDSLERILDEDPFKAFGLADYTVEEFMPTRFRDGLGEMLGAA